MHTSYLLAWALPMAAAESCFSVIAKTHTFTSTMTTVQFTTLPNTGCPSSTASPTALIPADDAVLVPTDSDGMPIPTYEARPSKPAAPPADAGSASSIDYFGKSSTTNAGSLPTANPVTITTAITPSAVHPLPSNSATGGNPFAPVPSAGSPEVQTSLLPSVTPPALPTGAPTFITTAITPSLVYPKPSQIPDAKPPVVPGGDAPEIPGPAPTTIFTAIKPSAIKPSAVKPSVSTGLPIVVSDKPSVIATNAPMTITTAITPSPVKLVPTQSVARLLPLDNAGSEAESDTPFAAGDNLVGEASFEDTSVEKGTVSI